MPFLDAKALETDPDGMAFLRAVIKPRLHQDEAVLRSPFHNDPAPVETPATGRIEAVRVPLGAESAEVAPVA